MVHKLGFSQGEVIDLSFVEKMNQFLIQKMTYEPLVLGITKFFFRS